MNFVTAVDRRIAPGKILCVGRNYVEHVRELGNELPEELVVFGKPNTAITDCLKSFHGEQLHYEGEICFLVNEGKLAYVGFGLDLTKRKLQERLKRKGLPWERCKAFDGSALFSAFAPSPGELGGLRLELRIDDRLVQQGGVRQMIYKPDKVLEELARFTRLNDGDIVMTGTPQGVGEVGAGSRFEGCLFSDGEELVRASWIAS